MKNSIVFLLLLMVFSSTIAQEKLVTPPYLKKGDTILQARAAVALTYCDRDYPILRDGDVEEFEELTPLYTCVYNGKPAKSFTLSSQITKPWINQFD